MVPREYEVESVENMKNSRTFCPKVFTLKPKPGSPIRFSSGIKTLSKIRFEVDEPRMPSLSSFLPSVKPSASRGTTKQEMP